MFFQTVFFQSPFNSHVLLQNYPGLLQSAMSQHLSYLFPFSQDAFIRYRFSFVLIFHFLSQLIGSFRQSHYDSCETLISVKKRSVFLVDVAGLKCSTALVFFFLLFYLVLIYFVSKPEPAWTIDGEGWIFLMCFASSFVELHSIVIRSPWWLLFIFLPLSHHLVTLMFGSLGFSQFFK